MQKNCSDNRSHLLVVVTIQLYRTRTSSTDTNLLHKPEQERRAAWSATLREEILHCDRFSRGNQTMDTDDLLAEWKSTTQVGCPRLKWPSRIFCRLDWLKWPCPIRSIHFRSTCIFGRIDRVWTSWRIVPIVIITWKRSLSMRSIVGKIQNWFLLHITPR